jgi:glyoxylase-like metal-dependent hydrolase (beta-lactamase superfamily II)
VRPCLRVRRRTDAPVVRGSLGLAHLHDVNAFNEAKVLGFTDGGRLPAPRARRRPREQAADLLRVGEDKYMAAQRREMDEELDGARGQIDVPVGDDEVVHVGELRFRVLSTPGVSPEHIVLYEASEGVCFVGDLIRPGSAPIVSDPSAQVESLQRVVHLIPETTILCPNHGSLTTMGAERRTNPHLVGIPGPKLLVEGERKPRSEDIQTAAKPGRFFFWM